MTEVSTEPDYNPPSASMNPNELRATYRRYLATMYLQVAAVRDELADERRTVRKEALRRALAQEPIDQKAVDMIMRNIEWAVAIGHRDHASANPNATGGIHE